MQEAAARRRRTGSTTPAAAAPRCWLGRDGHRRQQRAVVGRRRCIRGRIRLHCDARALQRLLQIKRTYPREPFLAALQQALKFGLFDLARLERLVLRHVAGDFFALGDDDGGDDGDEAQ